MTETLTTAEVFQGHPEALAHQWSIGSEATFTTTGQMMWPPRAPKTTHRVTWRMVGPDAWERVLDADESKEARREAVLEKMRASGPWPSSVLAVSDLEGETSEDSG